MEISLTAQCTEVRFVRFLSGGFTTMAVINPPDWKLANHTSVQWYEIFLNNLGAGDSGKSEIKQFETVFYSSIFLKSLDHPL